ncbi:thioredoxin-disulfide reductase [Patescibacteria group bacterium]|nr:thioredoxin-disulfide reductase [Patescibacteria group bacterium]MCL5410138.1 thioredoxin-disulfide reductase [Patescibacteria group bacterium]
MDNQVEKLVIIGSGPAGLSAAIYAARGNLQPMVISGDSPGGQLMITSDVEDYPGFPDGVQGPDLMMKFRAQAEKLGTRFIDESAVAVNFQQQPFEIKTETKTLHALSVVVATGANAKWLGLPSEQRLIGKGVSACAVCDGPFFKDKDVIVVGGGDAAFRETQYLSKICKSVTIVHRRDTFRAQLAIQDIIKSKPNVKFLTNSEVIEVLGEDRVSGVKIKNNQTNQISQLSINGVFVAIGHKPSTDFLKGQLEIGEQGYIVVHDMTKTSIEGVFVAGDVADFKYRQAVTAAGAGCQATLDVEDYLAHHLPH